MIGNNYIFAYIINKKYERKEEYIYRDVYL